MAKAVAESAGAPEPVLNIHPGSFTPAVVNDDKLTEETVAVFKKALGADHVHRRPPLMGGEDFALYGRKGVPSFLYFLGTQPSKRLAEAEHGPVGMLPSLHSPRFCPETEPTLKTGVLTMSLAVLRLLGK
jgi:hippurate hydrolase